MTRTYGGHGLEVSGLATELHPHQLKTNAMTDIRWHGYEVVSAGADKLQRLDRRRCGLLELHAAQYLNICTLIQVLI
jgi:hypothetical protein